MGNQNDVLGWSSTTWGMTETEVLEHQSDLQKLYPPAEFVNPKRFAIVGIPEKIIGGRSCGVYLFFDKTTHLNEVLINTNEENKNGYYETFLEMLTQKYGVATTSTKVDIVDKVTWVFPSTVIELQRIDASALDLPPFASIQYHPNLSRELSAL